MIIPATAGKSKQREIDPYTVLLCGFDSSIVDDVGRHTLTPTGDAQRSTVSPKYGQGCLLLDGNGDYISATSSSDMNFGTIDFTLEAWINWNNNVAGQHTTIMGKRDPETSGEWSWLILSEGGGDKLIFRSGGSTILTSTAAVSKNQWVHIVLSRQGTSLRQFINGVQDGSATNSTNLTSAADFIIGYRNAGYPAHFNGKIDDLRISKGIARYTSNFIPPKRLTKYVETNPVDPNTVLLMNFDEDFSDSTGRHTPAAQGDAQITTSGPKYGVGCGLFDGTGDYLSIVDSADWDFGTGDFTLEVWIYWDYNPASQHTTIIARGNPETASQWSWQILSDAGGDLLSFRTGASYILNSSAAMTRNQWVHIAACRASGTLRFFVNGVQDGSSASAHSLSSSEPVFLGYRNSGYPAHFNGKLDDLRISNVARYTANFTPPPRALSPTKERDVDPYTVLLSNFEGENNSTKFVDEAGRHTLTAAGDAKLTTADKKFGNSCLILDGNGDYISILDSADWAFGSEGTIETWFYPSTLTEETIVDQYVDNNNRTLCFLDATNLNFKSFSASASPNILNLVAAHGISTGAWSHIALVWSGGTAKAYINGTVIGSASVGTFPNLAATLLIGADRYGGSIAAYTNGKFDGFRITNGVARYTSNFTPQGRPFDKYIQKGQIDPYTVLLCSFDSGIKDLAQRHVLTPSGNAQISTTGPKFGKGSLQINNIGTDVVNLDNMSDLSFSNMDFTIEGWVFVAGTSGNRGFGMIDISIDGNTSIMILFGTSNLKPSGYIIVSGAYTVECESADSISNQTWTHVAFVRYGNTFRLFINGINKAEKTWTGTCFIPTSAAIGRCLRFDSYFTSTETRLIDDLRISKGIARYTANFIPPTRPHSMRIR